MCKNEPSTSWKEVIDPGEECLFNKFALEIVEMQKNVAKKENLHKAHRGFHAKIHTGVKAEFEVCNGIPEYARVGIFSEPKKFSALVRFSNGKPNTQSDKKKEPRGIAIKLSRVEGTKIFFDKNNPKAQDFLATSHSLTSAVRNAKQFIAFIRGTNPNTLKALIGMVKEIGFFEFIRIFYAIIARVVLSNVKSMATETYFGTAPIKFGPYAVKYTIRPSNHIMEVNSSINKKNSNFLREDLADRLQKGDLFFDFLIQFYVNEKCTPIEDTSILWKEKDAPFLKVGQLRIPSCDFSNIESEKITQEIDSLSFNPWHTIEEYKPLGSIMRARKIAYQASFAFRDQNIEPVKLSSK